MAAKPKLDWTAMRPHLVQAVAVGMSTYKLAELLGVTRQAVLKQLDRMHLRTKGQIEHQRQDDMATRIRFGMLTPEERHIERLEAAVKAAEEKPHTLTK